MFADGFFGMLVEQAKNGITICPGIIGPDYDPEDSVLDEIVGFVIAAQGLMFQLSHAYELTFPFNVLLSPLTFIEWLIRTQVGTIGYD